MESENLSYIQRLLSKLDLDVEGFEDEVIELYDRFDGIDETYRHSGSKDKVGRFIRSEFFICCLVYIVCKKRGMPRAVSRICSDGNLSDNEKSSFWSVYGEITNILDEPIKPFKVKDWIPRMVSLLNKEGYEAGEDIEFYAHELFEGFDGRIKGSLKVYTTAITYISYIMNGLYISQSEMARVGSTTETVMRDGYKNILEDLGMGKKFKKELKRRLREEKFKGGD